MKKTAIVIGATGLVGHELLLKLLNDDEFDNVKVFVRRPLRISHPKLKEILIDFNRIADNEKEITGDVMFCCIGTTIKAAGSKDAFYTVDASYPLSFAKAARGNLVKQFILISSLGANKASSNFYLSVKGTVEEGLKQMSFESLVILRPSMLLGKRKESRVGETIGKIFMKMLSFAFLGKLKKYKAIQAETVAEAMLNASKKMQPGILTLESDEIVELAG